MPEPVNTVQVRVHDSVYINAKRKLKGEFMSSEIIVIIVLVALAVIGLVWLEMHSRQNKRRDEQQSQSRDGN